MARKVVPKQYEYNRQSIMEATVDLMVKKSIAKLRLEDVAEKLGMTKAAIYWYFPGKEELINETAKYLYQFYTEYADEVMYSDGTPMEKLELIFLGADDSYDYQLMGLVPVKLFLEHYSDNCILKELIQKGYAQFYKVVEQILQEGIDAGAFHTELTAYEFTVLVSGIIDGLAFQNIMLSDDTLTVKRAAVLRTFQKMLQ